MDDLVEWLRAQLDEDERSARACAGDGEWDAADIAIYGADLAPEVRAHMAQHDPARVLREIDAKRQALDHYERIRQHTKRGEEPYVLAEGAVAKQVQIMALPYADRDGFREDWRP